MLNQLKWATLTVAAVLGLAYVMNLSAQTLAIGTWIAGAGGVLAFLSPIIGWLGTAVTGSDTSSNSLFGVLQVDGGQGGRDRPDAAGLGELLRRRARQDGLAAEPRDRRRRGRIGRSGGRPLPESHRLEPVVAADHVCVGVSAIDGGVVMDGRIGAAPEGPAVADDAAAGTGPARHLGARGRAAADRGRRVGLHGRAPVAHLRVRRAAAVHVDPGGRRAAQHAATRSSGSSRRARARRSRGSRAAPARGSAAARCRSRTAC